MSSRRAKFPVLPLYGAVLAFVLSLSTVASATTLGDAAGIRGDFILGDVDGHSYDGTGFDAFKPFNGFTGADILQFGSLTGGEQGSVLQFFLLSEVAHYDGNILPGQGDGFGLTDANGNFISLLGPNAGLGSMAEYTLGAGEQMTFALDSPESMFSSIDSENADGSAHMLGLQVMQDGLVTIPSANLFGDMMTFNLLAGDYIIFIEDLLASGNMLYGGMPSDFDFNDMVIIVREQAVPEPATYMLIALGMLMVYYHKRRQAVI